MKPITQLTQNNKYKSWVKELKKRYLTARMKASVEANRTLLGYYKSLGRDIAYIQYVNIYGSAFYVTLSHDLRTEMSGEQGFSETNIRYMNRFYELYFQLFKNLQPGVEYLSIKNFPQCVEDSEHGNLLHGLEVSKTKNHQRCVDESIE